MSTFGTRTSGASRRSRNLFAPKLADGLPELCFSTLPGTGELICIKRGESGYYPSDWNTNDPAHNREIADYNNERLGVTQEQRLAMECGSMHGWGVPGADPACYEQKQENGRDDPWVRRYLASIWQKLDVPNSEAYARLELARLPVGGCGTRMDKVRLQTER